MTGRIITNQEIEFLNQHFGEYPLIDQLIDIEKKHSLIESEFYLSKDFDSSGIGVRMKWLTPHQQYEETYKFYPGIIAIQSNFFPIGMCLSGSGNPYFIRFDNQYWNIYRILHDELVDDKLSSDAIQYVSELTCFINNGAIS